MTWSNKEVRRKIRPQKSNLLKFQLSKPDITSGQGNQLVQPSYALHHLSIGNQSLIDPEE
jgi:hypothetical protein